MRSNGDEPSGTRIVWRYLLLPIVALCALAIVVALHSLSATATASPKSPADVTNISIIETTPFVFAFVMLGALVMSVGLFGLFVVIGTPGIKLLMVGVFGYALARIAWGFVKA